tara:strand:- start:4507 stop:4665 length:159 start_codon:yes stop_codon:yes gene_type:complete
MDMINNNFSKDSLISWPGGKPYKDALINSIGDQFFFSIGYLTASYLDKYFKK